MGEVANSRDPTPLAPGGVVVRCLFMIILALRRLVNAVDYTVVRHCCRRTDRSPPGDRHTTEAAPDTSLLGHTLAQARSLAATDATADQRPGPTPTAVAARPARRFPDLAVAAPHLRVDAETQFEDGIDLILLVVAG
nr:hypothetical protein [Micromonospora sp. DSM 115978]